MAAPYAKTLDENVFECTICLEPFEEPKLLPCFHTFCKKCLSVHMKKSRKKNSFPCPNCRTNCKIPEKEADGFQTNFYVMAAISSEAKMKNKLIEMSITAASQTVGMSKDLTKDEHGLFDQPCPKHGKLNQVLRFYCTKCDMPICLHCKLTAHEGHDTQDLEDIIHKTKQEVKELTEKIKGYSKLYGEAKDKSTDLSGKLDHKLQTLKASVIDNAEVLHDMIDNRKKALLDIITRTQKKESNKIVLYDKQLEKTRKEMNDLIKNTSKQQERHDIVELLKLKSSLSTKIKSFESAPPDFNEQIDDLFYDRHEHQNGKARDMINNFLGQVKLCQSSDSPLNSPSTSSQQSTAQPVHHYRPHIVKNLVKEGPKQPVFRNLLIDTRHFWVIYEPIGSNLEQFNKMGHSLSKVNVSGKDISGIALLTKNSMVISCCSQKVLFTLQGLDGSNITQSFRSNLPETPAAVYYYDGHVYVLLCSKGSAKGLYDPEKMTWLFKNSMLKKPIDFIIKQIDGELTAAISDPLGKQVVFLTQRAGIFSVKDIYKGQGLKDKKLFTPKGISVTNRGHILVVDEGNNVLLQLDEKKAVLIGIVRLEFLGISKPLLVRYTKQNGVWITTMTGGLFIIKYQQQISSDLTLPSGAASYVF